MDRPANILDVYDRYQKFYLEYKDKLFSYLRFKSGDSELALDLMQDSFTKHFQHYGHEIEYKPALLFTIARNALTDHHRVRGKLRFVDHEHLHTLPSQESALQTREEVRSVLNAVERLSEEDRELLIFVVGGLPYREVATITGLSETAIKVKIHRIRLKIQRMINDEEA